MRTNLSLVPGTNVQAWDATLQSLSALGTVADRIAYTTGVDTWAETTLSSFMRSLLDDTTAAAAANTLLLGTGDVVTFTRITLGDGSAATASYAFVSNTDMGIYRSGADTMGVSFLGTQFVTWNSSGFASTQTGRYLLQEAASRSHPFPSRTGPLS